MVDGVKINPGTIGGAGYDRDDAHIGIDANAYTTAGFPTRVESDIDSGYRNLSLNAYAGRRFGTFDVDMSHWQTQGKTEYLDYNHTPHKQKNKNNTNTNTLKSSPRDAWTSSLKLSQ